MIKIIPNKKKIGAEVRFNLKNLSKRNLAIIKKALFEYGMIYFKNQKLNSKLYIKFAKNFGRIAKYPRLKGLSKNGQNNSVIEKEVQKEVVDICSAFPIYSN